MSTYNGEKCENLVDRDPDGWTDGRTETRTGITIPYYVPPEDGRMQSSKLYYLNDLQYFVNCGHEQVFKICPSCCNYFIIIQGGRKQY